MRGMQQNYYTAALFRLRRAYLLLSDVSEIRLGEHKIQCGKTDRIDMNKFYPLLAAINDLCSLHQEKPQHPATKHQILNSPNPGTGDIVKLKGVQPAKLVVLGEEIPMHAVSSPMWWPAARTDKVRGKMFRRINRQGFVLQRVLAQCLAILAVIYTTTSGPGEGGKQQRRVRLSYNSSSIADFGIGKGIADVKPQDSLLFYYTTTGEFELGQAPEDHY